MRSLREVQKLLEKVGIPGRDAYDLPDSPKRFPDGAHYRMESPVWNALRSWRRS